MHKKLGFTKEINISTDDLKSKLQTEFQKIGFTPIFDMDMRNLANVKLNQHFNEYYILGFYNLSYALNMINENPIAGSVAIANIVIYEINNKKYISAIDIHNMEHSKIGKIIDQINNTVKEVLEKV
jgi:uncharacterized protein (DUF302 family)